MAILLSFLFFATVIFLVKLNGGRRRRRQLNLPPSPPKLPIIGNLLQLGTLPHRSLRTISEKYGPLVLLHLGQIPTLIVSSEDMAEEILKTQDIAFANRPSLTAGKKLLYNCTDVAFSPYGEYWRQIKKICVLELLSAKRVNSFRFVREEEVAEMIEKISQSCSRLEAVDLTHLLCSLSSGMISRVAFGRKYEGEGEGEEGKNKFASLANELEVLMGAFSVGDFFPSFAWVDVLTGLDARLKRNSRGFDDFLDQVIKDHLDRPIDGADGGEQRDFVDTLLHVEKDSTLGVQLTRDNLKAIILDMFVGGTDTTSGTLVWAMAELMKYPTVMEKAQMEVRRVLGSKRNVEEEDLNQMDYLKCIVKETLRLHPSAPLLVPRESINGATIKDYQIPPKTRVLVNAWAIGRDPKLWENAEEFIPERFENNPVDFGGQNFRLIPFGAGRRGCPGLSFAVVAVELALANLLYWFDWKLPSKMRMENLDMAEASGLTVHKKTPLLLLPVHHSFGNN